MSTETTPKPSHIVVVVAVDLTEVSQHLLATARDLVRSVDDAELHVVHVVHPEPLRERLTEPAGSPGYASRAAADGARWELEELCRKVVDGSGARWCVHVRVGRPVDQVTRVATQVGSDVIVLEAHDHARRRLFHRSVCARIAQLAPCSVLTIRGRRRAAASVAA